MKHLRMKQLLLLHLLVLVLRRMLQSLTKRIYLMVL
jgi:hypothetical protein